MERRKKGHVTSIAELLKAEFGSPVAIPEGEQVSGKTFNQGAVCFENPNCRLVNTRACNYAKCVKKSTNGRLE